ncbi:hypothetical protein VTO42DRAFT_5474 [Malbranchea cinnamomea]
MRTSSYSLLAALLSAVGLQQSQCYAADAGRTLNSLLKSVKRPIDSPAQEKREVVVIPVTVVIGPDGKPTTLSDTSTATTALPSPSTPVQNQLLDLNDMIGITVGLDGIVSNLATQPTPELSATSSRKPTDGFTYSPGAGTGISSTPTPTTSSDRDLTKVLPTLPGFPDFSEIFPGKKTTETSSAVPSSSASAPDDATSISAVLTDSSTPSAAETTSSTSASESSKGWNLLPTLTDLLPPFPTPSVSTLSFPTLTISKPPQSQNGTAPATTTSGATPTSGPILPTSSLDFTIPIPTSIPSGVFPSPSWGSGSGTGLPTRTRISDVSPTTEPTTTSEATTSARKESTPVTVPTERPTPTNEALPPLSTDDQTTMVVPTEIVYQPSPTPRPSPTTPEEETPIPIPEEISPPDGGLLAPLNSQLVQLGFNNSLNYEFVATHSEAITQLFAYVPQGVTYGLGIHLSEVSMHKLAPYYSNLPYTVTLAMLYIPRDMVNKLSASLVNPASELYNHPSPPVNLIMSMIDPSIPLIPGQIPDISQPGSDVPGDVSRPDDENDESTDKDDSDDAGGSGKSSGVRASAVGIGLGVVGGAALYGAAMFFVARRYRRKRKMHQRTSSLTGGYTDDSRAGSPSEGFMSGFRDSRNSGGTGSARTAMISAPVMSENSLGWN